MSEQKPPICMNCQHIATNVNRDWTQYRCFAPENVVSTETNLVTGEEERRFKYEFCKDARKKHNPPHHPGCESEGNWFKQREIPATPPASDNLKLGDLDIEL